MHIAEVVTIAKSLPLLRLNTYKSLILSYSADFSVILREKVRDRGRLEHILEAIESIEEFHAQYTFEDIKKNKLIFYGFTKLVEVIGEAVYMLSTEFRDSHSDVNWRQIERMRHVLVHGYYTIDPESLWDTIEVDIPELKPWIVRYLSE